MVNMPRIDSFKRTLSGRIEVRYLFAFVLGILLFTSCQNCSLAGPIRIHLCYEKNIKTHLEYIAAYKKEIKKAGLNVTYIESSPENLEHPENLEAVDYIVSVGVRAAKKHFSAGYNKPTFYSLLPKNSLPAEDQLKKLACQPKCVFSILDQPVKRQFDLITHVLPQRTNIGVLYDTQSEAVVKEMPRLTGLYKIKLNKVRFDKSSSLLANLSPILEKSEVLFAIPDPEIYNRRTARSIILTTYHKKIPIFGYSEAYTRAGALFSLHSSPEQFARQDVEILTNHSRFRYGVVYPKYFTVSVNKTVARALHLQIDSASNLTAWLRGNNDISTED
jgi:ABC-type uncharacterized transport system substrate-binding protein